MRIKNYTPKTKHADNNMLNVSRLQPPIVRSVHEIFNRCYMQPELLSPDIYDSDFDDTEDLEHTPIEYADKFDMADKLRQPFEPEFVQEPQEPELTPSAASAEPSEPTE